MTTLPTEHQDAPGMAVGRPQGSTHPDSPWADDALVDELKRLWLGGSSASEVAAALGLTRNAVIGKVHRLKLQRGKVMQSTHSGKVQQAKRVRQKRTKEQQIEDHRVRSTIIARRNGGLHGNRGRPKANAIVHRVKTAAVDRKPLAPAVLPEVDETALIGLLELSPQTCKWPVLGTGSATRFCGCAPKLGKPYCEAHCAVAYGPRESVA